MTTRPTALEFLENTRLIPGQNRFAVGTYERGITFYRQQIRALNLIYALIEARDGADAPIIPAAGRIAIVGGGAFGVTAAAAAAQAGFEVWLLERHQGLLHLQHGCATRWLHPRLYDWPAVGSETRLARLPFLNWTAGTADQVALEVERQFLDLARKHRSKLKIVQGVTHLDVKQEGDALEVRYITNMRNDAKLCRAVVYAVGFGNEKDTQYQYWRNDCFGQSEMEFTGKDPMSYLVSGTGDGGFVDLFRLRIRDFSQDTTLFGIFDLSNTELIDALREIREELRRAQRTGSTRPPLYDRFNALEGAAEKQLEAACDRIRQLLRVDTEATLNGKHKSFRECLNTTKISFGNGLLAYCLHQIRAFQYAAGTCDSKNPLASDLASEDGSPYVPAPATRAILRHGSVRDAALRAAGLDASVVEAYRNRPAYDTSRPIYPSGWWWQFAAPNGKGPHIEFVPPALVTEATTFVSTLSDILRHVIDQRAGSQRPPPKFRVTLHRLIRLDDKEVFQQITPYFGRVDTNTGLGRFFPVAGGIVGVACRTGNLVVVRKEDQAQFDRVWKLTEFAATGAKAIKRYVDSLMACPFFAPVNSDGKERVSLVLFADSADPEFFDGQTLGIISAACAGFVRVLELLHETGALRSIPSFYSGFHPEGDAERVAQLEQLGVRFGNDADPDWKKSVTFANLTSLDLEIGRSG